MITGDDFLALAGRLAAYPAGGEAQWRTAVSRAYYAAFHVVKAYLGSLGVALGRSHGELQRCLLECGHPLAVAAGYQLADLQASRVKADYDLTNRDYADPRVARECVELAVAISTVMRDLAPEPEREQVRQGIEAYRRRIRPGSS